MSKTDAQRALEIYKVFGRQTDAVVQYLSLARQVQGHTRLEVPKLKHAPTTLTSSLEEYLNDPDFEINRRQYLAQQEAKRTGKPVSRPAPKPGPPEQRSMNVMTTPVVKPVAAPPPKGPAPDLIDFFESIEQNQQPMAQYSQPDTQQYAPSFAQAQTYQQPQVVPQPTAYNPFLQNTSTQAVQQPQPLQPDFTGAGFGGYGPQPTQPQAQMYGYGSNIDTIPQNNVTGFAQQTQFSAPQIPSPQSLQPQSTGTNPFRQSMIMNGIGMPNNDTTSLHRQSTNPFARFDPNPQPLQQASQQQAMAPIVEDQVPQAMSSQSVQHNFSPPPTTVMLPQRTGTNPFAKTASPSPTANTLPVHVTGSTNPFRQSQFVNQQTGQGWQHSSQGTMGGVSINDLPTTSIFPRPGVQQN